MLFEFSELYHNMLSGILTVLYILITIRQDYANEITQIRKQCCMLMLALLRTDFFIFPKFNHRNHS